MNLEQAIHAHWADSAALESVLSADRLTTGRTSRGTTPYATLQLRAIRRELPTNQGPAAIRIDFRINVWHDQYDEAKTIAEQVAEAFDRASLELADSDRVARVRHATDTVRQHADGRWQWTVDFVARVCLM